MHRSGSRGFTIIEVMVALSILVLVLGMLATSQITAVKLTNSSRGSSDIVSVAKSHLELVSENLLSSVETFTEFRDDGDCQAESSTQGYYAIERGCNYEDKVATGETFDLDGDGSGDIFAGHLKGMGEDGQLVDLDLDGSNGPEIFAGYDLDHSGTPDIYVTSWILQEQDAADSYFDDGNYSGPIRITVAALAAYDAIPSIGRLDPIILTKSVSCYDVNWEYGDQEEPVYRGTAPPSCPEI
jgi:prepilin-type N-terminal cleavage/methylation domain-containing protein